MSIIFSERPVLDYRRCKNLLSPPPPPSFVNLSLFLEFSETVSRVDLNNGKPWRKITCIS